MSVSAAGAPGASASSVPVQAPAGDSLRVFLLTFGPGAQVWERFGHNALWIHDPRAGTDIAYHYGLFDMSESGFLTRFLQGRMAYSMGSADALRLVDAYRRGGRSGTVQELRLTREQSLELQSFLEWNLRPENRVYRYHYFLDNCSTRIRDALDAALGGTLARELRGRATPISHRDEALALTGEDELLTLGLDLAIGPRGDLPLTRWELAFIPMRLRDDVRALTVERNGARLPLVAAERQIPAAGAPDERLAVPTGAVSVRLLWMLLLGLVLGSFFAGMAWIASARPGGGGARGVARWLLGIGGAAWGLVTGVLGVILLGLWTLTDHEFAHVNENLLQTNPLALALVLLVPLSVARRGSRTGFWAAAVLASLSLLGLVLHPLPLTRQANLGIIAVALPAHLGLLYALWRGQRG